VPATKIHFYQETPGEVPVLDWFRRPHADALRGDIRELRAKKGHVNYRILYFAHGRSIAILTHALTKETRVADGDIEPAIARKKRFERDPTRHTAEQEIADA
jgi:phage-related protein